MKMDKMQAMQLSHSGASHSHSGLVKDFVQFVLCFLQVLLQCFFLEQCQKLKERALSNYANPAPNELIGLCCPGISQSLACTCVIYSFIFSALLLIRLLCFCFH